MTQKSKNKDISMTLAAIILFFFVFSMGVTLAYLTDAQRRQGDTTVAHVGIELYHGNTRISTALESNDQIETGSPLLITLNAINIPTPVDLYVLNTGNADGIVMLNIAIRFSDSVNYEALTTSQASISHPNAIARFSEDSPNAYGFSLFINQRVAPNARVNVINTLTALDLGTNSVNGQEVEITVSAFMVIHSGNAYQIAYAGGTPPSFPFGILPTSFLENWTAWT